MASLVLLILTLVVAAAQATTLRVYNACPTKLFAVWNLDFTSSNVTVLLPGHSLDLNPASATTGRVQGRLNCTITGTGQCKEATDGSSSLAEFSFLASNTTYYDISDVDAHSSVLSIQPERSDCPLASNSRFAGPYRYPTFNNSQIFSCSNTDFTVTFCDPVAASASILLGYESFSPSTTGIQLFGDAELSKGALHLTKYGSNADLRQFLNSVGRAFYKVPLKLTDNISFVTSFTFSVQALGPLFGDGLTFVLASASFSRQPDSYLRGCFGNFLGLKQASGDVDFEAKFVAVEFDTSGDVTSDDNHIGIDVDPAPAGTATSSGSLTTMVQTMTNQLNNTYGIDIKGGGLITAWIDYDGPGRKLLVFAALNPKPKPVTPLLSYSIDLAAMLNDTNDTGLSFGFTSSTGQGYEVHTIYSWHFRSGPGSPTSWVISNASSNDTGTGRHKHKKVSLLAISASSIAGGFLLLFIIVVLIIFRVQKTKTQQKDEFLNTRPRKFTYKELAAATDDFNDSNLLGTGGFGSVYNGVIGNVEVAIKKCRRGSNQGEREFVSELETIGRLSHRNLVRLNGWCHEGDQLLLVYEYMPNGSLDRHLFNQKDGGPLDWKMRYDIACGLAAALHYLHEEWEQKVVHRDVKPSNVMLDAGFRPRLGDFGLARTWEHSKTSQGTITAVAGTIGYIAPEVARTMKPTTFSDVFSFGVVALVLASGRKAVDLRLLDDDGEVVLVDCAREMQIQGRLLDLADPELAASFDPKQMIHLLELGLACTQEDPTLRPTMRAVLYSLRGDCV